MTTRFAQTLRKFNLVFALASFGAVGACSSGGGSGYSGYPGAAGAEPGVSLSGVQTGQYVCEKTPGILTLLCDPEASPPFCQNVDAPLQRFFLNGVIETNGVFDSWFPIPTGFTVCLSDFDVCYDCVRVESVGADSNSTQDSCTGSASSCTGRPPGSCSTQAGCSLQTHIKYDGSAELVCKGSAKSCSGFSSAGSCEAQNGCSWK